MITGSTESGQIQESIPAFFKKEISALGYKLSVRTDVDSNFYKPFYDFACDPDSYEVVKLAPQVEALKNSQLGERRCSPFSIELLDNRTNNIIGCVASTLHKSDESISNHVLEVDFLAVAPELQRKGLGTLLMKTLIEVVRQLPVSKIVLEPKDIAEGFYTKKLNMRRIILPNADVQMELLFKK